MTKEQNKISCHRLLNKTLHMLCLEKKKFIKHRTEKILNVYVKK